MRKAILAALLILTVAAAVIIKTGRIEESETSAIEEQKPAKIAYADGMLKVTSRARPYRITLAFHNGEISASMAFTLADAETFLPPAYGDGEYSLYSLDTDEFLGGCEAKGTDGQEMFLRPTLTMAKAYQMLSSDIKGLGSLEGITGEFAESFSTTAEPNEGQMSPYTPDPMHTAVLRKGACADLTALYVLYLRSAGIPAKAVYGDRISPDGSKSAHAWAEAYVDGEWKIIDITSLCAKKDISELFADRDRYTGEYCVY